jgi:hypothetical protein
MDGRTKGDIRGWLQHRAGLRKIGFLRGFQWLDGSFVEQKNPKDLDVVSFLYRPSGINNGKLLGLMKANLNLFDRDQAKASFLVDFFPVDLDGSAEALVNITRYLFGLFSHRRGDDLWKGMLHVRIDDNADDVAALTAIGHAPVSGGGTSP